MVDHQVGGHQGIDLIGIAAEALHGAAHRGQIDDGRHPSKILQNNTSRLEGNFDSAGAGGEDAPARGPVGKVFHVLFADDVTVAVAQQRFQEHADRIRQRIDLGESHFFQLGEAVDARRSVTSFKSVAGAKGIDL